MTLFMIPIKGVIVFLQGAWKEQDRQRHEDPDDGDGGRVRDVVEVGYFGAGQYIPCDELSCRYGWLYDRQHQECEGDKSR